MLKDYLTVALLILYFLFFSFWILWFYKSLTKSGNKNKIYLVNISGFVVVTYFISFLILNILS